MVVKRRPRAGREYVGALIKEARVSFGISQSELGKMLGKTRDQIASYELGLTMAPVAIKGQVIEQAIRKAEALRALAKE